MAQVSGSGTGSTFSGKAISSKGAKLNTSGTMNAYKKPGAVTPAISSAIARPAAMDATPLQQEAPAAYSSGGGGGGSVAAAPVAPAVPAMSLDDFVKSNFLYTAEQNEGKRRLDDFDADTLRQRQATESDQTLRRATLRRQLDDMGTENAEDMAGRGLLRSGLTFQNQDKINAEGVEQENSIQKLLTDLLTSRGQGRVSQEAANRAALNDRISSLTDQFNTKQTAGLTV